MSEQKPRAPVEDEDERTVFVPGPRPAAEEATVIAGVHGPTPFGERTIVRPRPALERPARGVVEPRPEPATPPPPRPSTRQSLGLEAANENPFVRAATPLLLLLGRLRTSLIRAMDSSLVPQIAAAIEAFERELRSAEVPARDIRTAKFVLCVSADEVLANLPRGAHDIGDHAALLTRFFGQSDGGREFLEELDRAREDPEGRAHILELFHACLALCFQGGQSSVLGGPATLQDLRLDLRERLRLDRPSRGRIQLSPRWEGQPLPSRAAHVRVPLWAAASFVALGLFAIFVGLRISLGAHAEAVATALLEAAPPDRIEIRQDAVPPPSPPPPSLAQATQLEHIRKMLEPGIAAGKLTVRATPNQILIVIPEKALFPIGRASLGEDAGPLVMLVAYAIDDETGPVKVFGHADSGAASGPRFATSFELSQDRARAVASLLARALSDPSRVTAEGKGPDVPRGSEEATDAEPTNARIEVVIPRSDA